jgi:hypothetical protein
VSTLCSIPNACCARMCARLVRARLHLTNDARVFARLVAGYVGAVNIRSHRVVIPNIDKAGLGLATHSCARR